MLKMMVGLKEVVMMIMVLVIYVYIMMYVTFLLILPSLFFDIFKRENQASRAHNLWVSHTVAAAIPARDQNNDRKLSFINLCSIKISKTPKLSSSKAIGIYNISHFNSLCLII